MARDSVKRVIDGDTFELRSGERVLVAGVNAPELEEEGVQRRPSDIYVLPCLAVSKASRYLSPLVKKREEITVQKALNLMKEVKSVFPYDTTGKKPCGQQCRGHALSVKDLLSRGYVICKPRGHPRNYFYWNWGWKNMLELNKRGRIIKHEFVKGTYRGKSGWYLTYNKGQIVTKTIKVIKHNITTNKSITTWKKVPIEILSGDIIQTVQDFKETVDKEGRKTFIPMKRHASIAVIENEQLWFVDTWAGGRITKGRYRTHSDSGPKVVLKIERYKYDKNEILKDMPVFRSSRKAS